MNHLWRNYSLSIVLAALFLISWGLQTWTGWIDFKARQQTHGEPGNVLGPNGYVWQWAHATFQNWQSEFLHLLAFVVLTSFLVHRGSRASTEGEEELRAAVRRIEQQLAEQRRPPPAPPMSGSDTPATPSGPDG